MSFSKVTPVAPQIPYHSFHAMIEGSSLTAAHTADEALCRQEWSRHLQESMQCEFFTHSAFFHLPIMSWLSTAQVLPRSYL